MTYRRKTLAASALALLFIAAAQPGLAQVAAPIGATPPPKAAPTRRREGDNAYVGGFAMIADGVSGIDGISETDGLDVTSASLGAGLESGAFIAQDGRNVSPPENQNFKLVPWSAIAGKLGLP